jgi:hypothetical protein
MKKILFLTLLSLPALIFAGPRWVPLASGNPEMPAQFTVLKSSAEHTVIQLEIAGIYVDEVTTPAGQFQTLSLGIPAGGLLTTVGSPQLPVVARFLAIPDDRAVDINILEQETIVLTGYNIYPAQPPQPENAPAPPFVLDEKRYTTDQFYPETAARASDPMIMRDFRLVQLVLQPVQFNPVSRELRVTRRLKLELRYDRPSGINVKIRRPVKISRAFEPLYRSFIANYRFLAPPQRAEDGSYLIIVNDQFASAVTPFAEWKRRKGWRTRVVTTSEIGGNDTARIYNYIHNAYLNWPNPPDYVLLVGDAPEYIRCNHWPGNTDASDLYYSLHEGSDLLPDLMIARVCVRTLDEARAVLNKLYLYEQEPYLANTEWFKKVCALAAYESSQPTRFWTVVIRIRNYVLGRPFTQFDTLFQRWGLNTAQRLTDSLNAGRAWMLYRGHGDVDAWANVSPSWTNSNVYALNNGRMTPMVIAPTCLSGNFDESNDCHAEAWLKAGEQKGGIGYFGASEVSYSGYNDSLAAGTFISYVDSLTYTFAQCTQWGKLFMLLAYPLPDPTSEEELYMFNNFGDPELNIWSATPRTLTVSHPATVHIGSFPFPVTVSSNSAPVPDAQVCVMSCRDTAVYYVGHTDAAGQVLFNITATLPGDSLYVTVTGRNLQPYLGAAITVAPNSPYVTYLRSVIDDSLGGNNDHIINPGETVNLPTWVKNWGSVTANSVSGVIRLTDPWVTILDSVKSFGTILAHDSAFTGRNGFRFQVAPACTNGHIIRFTLVCRDASDSVWNSYIVLRVGAPRLDYAGLSVVDTAAGGNRNGWLDPQESADLIVALRNTGFGNAAAVSAVLRSGDPRLTVNDSLGSFGLIMPDSVRENRADPFRVTAGLIPLETRIPCTLYVTAQGGYSRVIPFTVLVGEIRACDPIPDTGGVSISYWAYDDVDTLYTKHPQFEWVEIRGLGTRLTLNDDQTVQVNLPPEFGPFVFYGQSFTQISVCSNGWVAPGYSTATTYTNTALPNSSMPPLLAANWDDLYPPTGNSVWYYHDTANHRFIIEWDSVHYFNPREQWDKFQIILYDTTRGDGDCEFQFQYLTANNYTSNTVGEQDPSASRYIQVVYNGSYHRGAAPLVPGRAILFTPEGPQTGLAEPAVSESRLPRLSLTVAPNPVSGRAQLVWQVPQPGRVRLSVYDASGRLVRTLLNTELSAGRYQAVWDLTDDAGRKLANGIYLYRLETPDRTITTKAVLMH